MIVARFLHCPECGQLRQFHGALYAPWDLQCVRCAHQWTQPPALSAIETILALRTLLEGDCDASRRSFYNASSTLAAMARLVDEFPTLVPPCTALEALVGDSPGDVRSSCPFCGELVAHNPGEQRVSHVEPICETFDREIRKQPNFTAAVEWLNARTVSA